MGFLSGGKDIVFDDNKKDGGMKKVHDADGFFKGVKRGVSREMASWPEKH